MTTAINNFLTVEKETHQNSDISSEINKQNSTHICWSDFVMETVDSSFFRDNYVNCEELHCRLCNEESFSTVYYISRRRRQVPLNCVKVGVPGEVVTNVILSTSFIDLVHEVVQL